jgi:hypothetical protein
MPTNEIARIAALFGIDLRHMTLEDWVLLERVLDALAPYYPKGITL